MTRDKNDRSVRARDVMGSQVITGDKNTAAMSGIQVTWPQPETVAISDEIAALKQALASLNAPEQGKLDRAMADAEEEAAKQEPDKGEIGDAIKRVVRYAKEAIDFSDHAERLAPKFAAIISWLGSAWSYLADELGLPCAP